MVATLGFNLGGNYASYKRINVYMNTQANLQEIEQIVSENHDGEYKVAFADEFNDMVTIRVKDINEEELNAIKEKLTEKYAFEEVIYYQ